MTEESNEALRLRSLVLATVHDLALDGILVVDERDHVLSFNHQFASMWSMPADVLGKKSDRAFLAAVKDQLLEPETFLEKVRYLYEHQSETCRDEIALTGGRIFERYSAPMHGDDGRYYGRVWYFRDITAHKWSDRALDRANGLLRTVAAGNDALVRSQTESELMRRMCDVIVQVGTAGVATIALLDADGHSQILASAGKQGDGLRVVESEWNAAGTEGSAGYTIRTGVIHIHDNWTNEPDLDRWRDALAARDVRTCVYVPLKEGSVSFGSLGIYFQDSAPIAMASTALLTELAGDLAYGLLALRHRAEQDAGRERLRKSLEDTVVALAATAEMRDPYTAGHQRRVAQLATAIARSLGLDENRVHGIHVAAVVHDIGKLRIPAELLTTPKALTSVEKQLLETHVEAGYEALKGIDFPWPVATIVRQHHERIDGSGYPFGLMAGAICIEAKILGVADMVEAASANRPYRPGKSIEAALHELEAGRDIQYDPAVVDTCLALFRTKGFTFT